ncbi:hypothetical protein SteCoe_36506 [Stentor coeruleus]|uniref:Uncharacterized protein n=1 Tax=Stentor coeruleus TaxID=5963 RepID=A0A1R2AQ00_9CILI|nr:hypothetical protein SteCoe_36506 [Stentor coeruleus]
MAAIAFPIRLLSSSLRNSSSPLTSVLTRCFSSSEKSAPKPIPSDLCVDVISDFNKLPETEQKYLTLESYKLLLATISGLSFPTYQGVTVNKQALVNKLILIREKNYNTYVGFSFAHVFEIFFKPSDKSRENRYITTTYYNGVLSHFRGYDLGRALMQTLEYSVQNEFPDSNRVSFNITLNPYYYDLRSRLSPLVVPGPRPVPNSNPEELLKKTMETLGLKALDPKINPYVISLESVHPAGVNQQEYLDNAHKYSIYSQYHMQQTKFRHGLLLCNLSFYNLIENNTLGLPSGKLTNFKPVECEVNNYKPKFG